MESTTFQQLFIFITAALCGIGLGILFDIFRIIRKMTKPSYIRIGIQDMLYWIAAAVLVFWYIFTFNNGELRWFEFAGVFLFGLLYNYTLSKFMVKIGVFLCIIFKKIAIIIIKIVLMPIALLYRIFKKPFFLVLSATGKGARRYHRMQRGFFSKIRQSLQNFCKIFKKV